MGSPRLRRYSGNPLIAPRSGVSWETGGTFNPAVFSYNGKVFILYRQISSSCVSTIGLAISDNGFEISERLDEPVYVPREPFEVYPGVKKLDEDDFCRLTSRLRSISGGSCFGVEDPRVTLLDRRVYMTYVAYNGVDPPRGAITWIDLGDFLSGRWDKWAKPILITHPRIPDKSVVLLPRRIGGFYVFFHRIFPYIWIDRVRDLSELRRRFLWGRPAIRTRPRFWDSRKIGAGSVVEWRSYFLLVYYGVSGWDEYYRSEGLSPEDFYPDDGYKYKVGLMVLDGSNPENVVYRSGEPIGVPEEWYEVDPSGKPNVMYPTGAIIIDDMLVVYYGASDRYVAAGFIELSEIEGVLEKSTSLYLRQSLN